MENLPGAVLVAHVVPLLPLRQVAAIQTTCRTVCHAVAGNHPCDLPGAGRDGPLRVVWRRRLRQGWLASGRLPPKWPIVVRVTGGRLVGDPRRAANEAREPRATAAEHASESSRRWCVGRAQRERGWVP